MTIKAEIMIQFNFPHNLFLKITLLVLLWPCLTRASESPSSVRLFYEVKSSQLPFKINSQLDWIQTGKNYQATLIIQVLNIKRIQVSSGSISSQGLVPQEFTSINKQKELAQFDWEKNSVDFKPPAPKITDLQNGAQDKLSVMLQIGRLLQEHNPTVQIGQVLNIQTIGSRGAEVREFKIVSNQQLQLPGGSLATV